MARTTGILRQRAALQVGRGDAGIDQRPPALEPQRAQRPGRLHFEAANPRRAQVLALLLVRAGGHVGDRIFERGPESVPTPKEPRSPPPSPPPPLPRPDQRLPLVRARPHQDRRHGPYKLRARKERL